jgi:hypothetical protein
LKFYSFGDPYCDLVYDIVKYGSTQNMEVIYSSKVLIPSMINGRFRKFRIGNEISGATFLPYLISLSKQNFLLLLLLHL